jgi:hypothetical protein
MMLRCLSTAFVLVLALAACAPSAGSFATPYDLDGGEAAQVSPGGSVHARATYRTSAFGYPNRGAFEGLYVPCGAQTTCLVVTGRFELVDVIAPEGWVWRVERVDAVRRSGRPETLAVTLRLDVPRDAPLGGRELRARLRARTGESVPVSLVVQVVSGG